MDRAPLGAGQHIAQPEMEKADEACEARVLKHVSHNNRAAVQPYDLLEIFAEPLEDLVVPAFDLAVRGRQVAILFKPDPIVGPTDDGDNK